MRHEPIAEGAKGRDVAINSLGRDDRLRVRRHAIGRDDFLDAHTLENCRLSGLDRVFHEQGLPLTRRFLVESRDREILTD